KLVALSNPLSADMDVLRPTLLIGLIHAVRHNVSRKNNDVALFEVGRVFSTAVADPRQQDKDGRNCHEQRRIAIALTGARQSLFWSGADRDARFDTYDLKGVLEEFLERFGIRGVVFTKRAESTALFLESATIQI